MKCIFTIDVEDWFHILGIPSAPALEEWDKLPSRVENNYYRLLDILSEKNLKATCFFLGWIAEKYPHLVSECVSRGHEIASHGYGHKLVYKMSEKEFSDDAIISKKIIEDISGQKVNGYRSAGFSITEKCPWFFDALVRAGYKYDSSIFPARRGYGGIETAGLAPGNIKTPSGKLIEFPISVANILGMRVCFFGGGYLRLFPERVINIMARKVLLDNRPVIFYIHPRDIDPEQPRLPMNMIRRFKSYVNLRGTENKVRRLLDRYSWVTMKEFMKREFIQ
ncbi:MAG: XrtA system polysaccharide deacetylase [candidate division Zixibacteria bacterium]